MLPWQQATVVIMGLLRSKTTVRMGGGKVVTCSLFHDMYQENEYMKVLFSPPKNN